MFDVLRKCLFFIDRSTRIQAVGIGSVMILGTAMEAVGIGLVFPLVEVISDPSILSTNEWAQFFFGDIDEANRTNILFVLAGMFFAAILIKNALLLLSYILQGWFFAKNEALLSRRLFAHYMQGDYRRFLTRNSSELINHVVSTTAAVYSHAMRSIITLGIECLLVITITVVLLVASPTMTISAIALMVVAIGLMYAFTRRWMIAWGERNVVVKQKILQHLQQGMHSIKEVKVFGREIFILDGFEEDRRELAGVNARLFVMGNVPRLWIETATVGGIILGICYVLSSHNNATSLFSIFALFAAAIFRLIPSFNRILMAMNSLRGGTYPVRMLYDDLNDGGDALPEADLDRPALPFRDRIELEDVCFAYPGSVEGAAIDINLTIRHGETIGLVGASGAGKTTLADIVLGLLTPDSGRIRVDGQDIAGDIRAWQRNLGYVPQTVYLGDNSLRRNIAFGIPDADIDEARVCEALRHAQLENFVATLPDGIDTFVGDRGTRLSGGQRQRVGIARALYHDPDVLVLDEATSSLDSEAEYEISAAIERLSGKKTIIIIAHRLSTLRSCDRLVYMADGRIQDCAPFDELARKNTSFKKLVELSKFTS